MKTSLPFRIGAGAIVTAITVLLSTSAANAQATRTWVSGVGDDVNPCSRTAPGKTFPGAISKTAAGGEINVLDPGGYGTVTILKSITIDGGGFLSGVLASAGNAITVNAGADGVVTLRNLDINGLTTATNGINIVSAAEVNIEDCVIYEFAGKGIDIAATSGCRVNILRTTIRGCAAGAVHAHTSSGAAVVTISKSNLLNSLFGYRGEDRSTASIDDSVSTGNVNNGILVATTATAGLANVNNCTVTDNGVNGIVTSGANSTIRMSLTTVSANGTGLSHPTGAVISFGNNRVSGNTVNGVASSTTPLQ